FYAILFTRALHHIHPLDQALRRAVDSLADGGRIIVEDFAYESADEKTLRWFASAIRLIEAEGLLVETDALLSKTETVNAWREDHGHELHTAAEIGAELEKVDRREKSRANREQLRCCNWIRLPKGNPRKHSGVKAGRRGVPRMRNQKPGARIFDRSTSFAVATALCAV